MLEAVLQISVQVNTDENPELKAMFSWFDWALYFDTTFGVNNLAIGDEETVIVVQPDFLLAAETLDRTPETVGM